jgi:putative DNA primase/helicase
MSLIDLRELERALYFIPATLEREKWIEIGDALKTSGIAFEVFDNWSATGDGYNAKTCRQQWKSFNGSHKSGTLIYYAMQYGYVADKSVKPDYAAIERERAESKKRAEQQKRIQAQFAQEAAIRCFNIWQSAIEATNNHPYLIKKQVPAIGLKIDAHGHLLVPVLNAENQLQSLQIISPQGEKLFAKNSLTAGGFYQLGNIADDSSVINITEGYATAATIISLTQQPIFIAFSASNLTAVAQLVRKRHPKNPVVICADNDHLDKQGAPRSSDKNTGVINAKKAAEIINATVCIPYCAGSDFNDLFSESGRDECLKQLKGKVLQAPVSQLARSAIALLLQNPHLAQSVVEKMSEWEGLEFSGLDILKILLRKILNYPAANTADLVEMYRGMVEEKVIQEVAGMKFLFPESGIAAEFSDAVNNLIVQAKEARVTELLEKGKSQSLNTVEKEQLKKMLIDKR